MKNKEYYLGLNYPILINKIYEDGEWLFTASIKELPGLIVYGETLEEVCEEIELAKADWIEANLEWGREIKEPLENSLEEYSGKITLRIAKTLHRDLKERSEIEGISLNQTIVQLINDGIYKQTQNSFEQLASKFEIMTKQFSRTIEEKVSSPVQHFHYIVKGESQNKFPYKEQDVPNRRNMDVKDNVFSLSFGG